MKKILIATISLAMLAGLGYTGWYFFIAPNQKAAEVEGLPLKMQKVYGKKIFSPVPSKDGQSIWFFGDGGRVFRLASTGETTEYPMPPLSGSFVSAVWPEDGQDFLVTVMQGGKNFLFYFSSVQKKYFPLPTNITNPVWIKGGSRIAFVWRSGDGKSQQLAVSNPDGSGYSILASLPWPDFDIYPAPHENKALMIRSNVTGKVNKIYSFSLEDGKYESIIEDGINTYAVWSPSGDSFAFIQGGKLKHYEMATRQVRDLGVQTNRGKVAFDLQGRNIYAAARNPGGKGDKIVRISLNDFAVSDYFIPDREVVSDDLVVGAGGVYFQDRKEEGFYRISK